LAGMVAILALMAVRREWRIEFQISGHITAEAVRRSMIAAVERADLFKMPKHVRPEDVDRWLTGTLEEALELQKPANDEASRNI
jgi:hypothetical protein